MSNGFRAMGEEVAHLRLYKKLCNMSIQSRKGMEQNQVDIQDECEMDEFEAENNYEMSTKNLKKKNQTLFEK